ncbi:MAG: MFS transporter [Alphaproteobacteria bacterium]|nr:MAG: MFS transporter [Alphaproteobacteria bacterium]
MHLVLGFAPILLSVLLLQLSSGGVAPLDALSGLGAGFSPTEIGLLGSAHFAGFFAGCLAAPRLMGGVGHSRSFAAFAAAGAIGILGHTLTDQPLIWALLRVLTGLCIAGCYTVIEGWLHARLTNAVRGRAMGAYRLVDTTGSLGAQLLIAVLTPGAWLSYNILAILCCASLLPLALTRLPQPATVAAPRLRPLASFRLSPLAVSAVVVAGVTSSSFRMIGPIYGIRVGLAADQIALFLAAFVLGGALAQVPAGWIADRVDRRHVLIGLSLAAIATSALTVAAAGQGTAAVFAAATAFGMATFPVFSVASAHANDFARPEEAGELSAALIFFYAIGAIASPSLASALVAAYGPEALFALVAVAHLALALIGLMRMFARPSAERRTSYTWVPRTSLLIGRLLHPRRARGGAADASAPGLARARRPR